MPGAASLAQALPYWAIVGEDTADPGRPRADFLVLKDGSVVLGFASPGVDVTGASLDELLALDRAWERAYASLPTGGFIHASFATAAADDALVTAFAERSHPGAHPLLHRGRLEQAAALRQGGSHRQVQLTYWLGLRGAAKAALHGAGAARPDVGAALLARACRTLWALAADVRASLAGQKVRWALLDQWALQAQLAAAVAPGDGDPWTVANDAAEGPTAAPTPPWDAPLLSQQLARRSLAVEADALALLPPYGAQERPLQLRLLGLAELPPFTQPATLHDTLFAAVTDVPLRLVWTHEKTDQLLQRAQLQQRRKVLFALIGRYFADHQAKQAYADTEGVLEEMAQRDAHVLRTSLGVCVGPASVAAQQDACRCVVEAFGRRGLRLEGCEDAQLQAWLATLPGYGYAAPRTYRVLHNNAAHLTPVFLPHPGDAEPDLLLHNRQGGLSKLAVRLGQRHDASALVVGKTGSGKTFLFSWLAKYGCLDLGGHVVVADNKGPQNSSYRPLCALLGGSYVHLKHDDEVSFSPFPTPGEVQDAHGNVERSRLEGLESILLMMSDDPHRALHPDYARNVVRRAVYALYDAFVRLDRTPRLRDAVAACRQLQLPTSALAQTASTVAERLQLWCEDPVRSRLFDTDKTLNTDNKLTVFDFHGFTRDSFLAAVLISVLAQRIDTKMSFLPRDTPKLFAFDEAWAMFDGSAEATSLLNRLYRTARSYGACVYTLTQSHHDVMQSAAARGIMANVGLTYLMRHQDGHADAAATFGLNAAQLALFRDLQLVPGVFAEALLVDAHFGRTRVLRYRPTAFDLWCDTSRAQDVALREAALAGSALPLTQTIALLARLCPTGAPADAAERARCLATIAEAGQRRRRAS